MTNADIKVYGADWCGDCRRAKSFMEEHAIRFEWIDVQDDPEARMVVESLNNGKRIIPTIIFLDGSILVEPSNAQLAWKLGIGT
jgi:glutaredoxin-like protein